MILNVSKVNFRQHIWSCREGSCHCCSQQPPHSRKQAHPKAEQKVHGYYSEVGDDDKWSSPRPWPSQPFGVESVMYWYIGRIVNLVIGLCACVLEHVVVLLFFILRCICTHMYGRCCCRAILVVIEYPRHYRELLTNWKMSAVASSLIDPIQLGIDANECTSPAHTITEWQTQMLVTLWDFLPTTSQLFDPKVIKTWCIITY